ncbi:MAG: aromatic hydrocarbon degradation protein [Tannerella sp.]|jgi:long-chain fatty acid transport protein|nr:aromatic hydrocarbon degradation protein [Tannerella sp.]
MNKLKFLSVAVFSFCMMPVSAGGLLTNTNQSAHFIRMIARDASLQIDAVYTNPAGLVKLSDGFHFSFTNQSAFQTRTITSTFDPFTGFGGNREKTFEGEASAPVIPSFQGAYKTGKWVLSGSFAVSGGGGKATFNDGLPSFESVIATLPVAISAMGVSTDRYSVDAYMRGSSFIYGGQLGGSYAISELFSAYAGFRLNVVNNRYEGYLKDIRINPRHPLVNPDGDMMLATDFLNVAQPALAGMTADREIDNKQSGWGISPIVGFNFNYGKLNVGMKYEFKASLNLENSTVDGKDGGLPQFKNGVNTPHDIPALFTAGVSYQITPRLQASAGYHHFFDSDADMADDKQNYINGGINEYLAGAEYRINRLFLLSAGVQFTQTGVTDEYQKDLSFSLDSYSIGLGGAVNVSKNVVINIGYFWTGYSDWTVEKGNYATVAGSETFLPGKDVYSRTNKVFAAGVDFSF